MRQQLANEASFVHRLALQHVLQVRMRVDVGSSIGVALSAAEGSLADELLAHADQAMFESKRAGRGGIRFHD